MWEQDMCLNYLSYRSKFLLSCKWIKKKRQAASQNSKGLILQQWLLQVFPLNSLHEYILFTWELSVNQPKFLKKKHYERSSKKWE